MFEVHCPYVDIELLEATYISQKTVNIYSFVVPLFIYLFLFFCTCFEAWLLFYLLCFIVVRHVDANAKVLQNMELAPQWILENVPGVDVEEHVGNIVANSD